MFLHKIGGIHGHYPCNKSGVLTLILHISLIRKDITLLSAEYEP